MSCENEARQSLRKAGRRATSPRTRIAAALRHAGGHHSAAEIHQLVQGERDGISLSTVYRTLETLEDARLVARADVGRRCTEFQWLDTAQPHHHIVCERCGGEGDLDPAVVVRIAEQIREATGFEPNMDHSIFGGRCASCREGQP